MAYDPEDNLRLSRHVARILTVLVGAAVTCLLIGLAAHHVDAALAWPLWLIQGGTGIVVAAPIIALGGIALGSRSRRDSRLALLGILLAIVGAAVAR